MLVTSSLQINYGNSTDRFSIMNYRSVPKAKCFNCPLSMLHHFALSKAAWFIPYSREHAQQLAFFADSRRESGRESFSLPLSVLESSWPIWELSSSSLFQKLVCCQTYLSVGGLLKPVRLAWNSREMICSWFCLLNWVFAQGKYGNSVLVLYLAWIYHAWVYFAWESTVQWESSACIDQNLLRVYDRYQRIEPPEILGLRWMKQCLWSWSDGAWQ